MTADAKRGGPLVKPAYNPVARAARALAGRQYRPNFEPRAQRYIGLATVPRASRSAVTLPCAHGPSRAASLMLCERSERADFKLNKHGGRV